MCSILGDIHMSSEYFQWALEEITENSHFIEEKTEAKRG